MPHPSERRAAARSSEVLLWRTDRTRCELVAAPDGSARLRVWARDMVVIESAVPPRENPRTRAAQLWDILHGTRFDRPEFDDEIRARGRRSS